MKAGPRSALLTILSLVSGKTFNTHWLLSTRLLNALLSVQMDLEVWNT